MLEQKDCTWCLFLNADLNVVSEYMMLLNEHTDEKKHRDDLHFYKCLT